MLFGEITSKLSCSIIAESSSPKSKSESTNFLSGLFLVCLDLNTLPGLPTSLLDPD
jgi:hypothetical protein